MNRKYPDHPIVGVGGIIFQGDQVLLIKRGKEPGLGQWSIPGGVVRPGETLKEAVVREILEETHLKVEVLALAKVLERIFRDPDGRVAYHYVLADFLCQPLEGTLQPDSDAQDARFVPLGDLPSYEVVSVTLEVIRRADWLRKNPGAEIPPPGIGKSCD
jgi:ADP-ribose pyrophosphatase YjhB (NUDIX family)